MRLVLAVLVALLAAAPADAQFRRSQKPFAEKGDFALLAEFSGLNVLQLQAALDGIGMRYRVADQTVLGASVGLGVFNTTRDGDQGGSDQSSDRSRTNARLSTWVEQHVGRPSRVVSPFVGLGVTAEVFNEEVTETRPAFVDGQTVDFERTFETSGFAVGGGVFVGAEVRLASRITLGGAYTLGLNYRDEAGVLVQSGVPGQEADDEFENSTLSIGTGVSDLVLSVYF